MAVPLGPRWADVGRTRTSTQQVTSSIEAAQSRGYVIVGVDSIAERYGAYGGGDPIQTEDTDNVGENVGCVHCYYAGTASTRNARSKTLTKSDCSTNSRCLM